MDLFGQSWHVDKQFKGPIHAMGYHNNKTFLLFLPFEFFLMQNNKIVNLSTKWVSQWGMVGYAHKKYKNNIFLMRQNWIHQKDSKNCTLVSGQLIALDSHRHGSSSESVCLDKMELWVSNLRAQHVQWAVIEITLYFFSFWFFFNENNKIKSQTQSTKRIETQNWITKLKRI